MYFCADIHRVIWLKLCLGGQKKEREKPERQMKTVTEHQLS